MNFTTADLVDASGDSLQSCDIQFRQFGGRKSFYGPARTIWTRDDNLLIRKLLAEPGQGAVLVVDGAGSLATALMGDKIAASACGNGWSGIIVHGAVRDSVALSQMELGLKALGTNPRKSAKNGTGSMDVIVTFGGVNFAPGHWVYSDEDGVVVSPGRLHP